MSQNKNEVDIYRGYEMFWRKKKRSEGPKEASSESCRQVLILAIYEDEPVAIGPMSTSSHYNVNDHLSNYVWQVFRENRALASKKYMLVDWSDLNVIPEKAKYSDISAPGILILVPKASAGEMEQAARHIKETAMQSHLREVVWKHAES